MATISKDRAKKIVTIAYYTILNRKPDNSGLTTYTNKIISSGWDDVDVAYALFTSKEYQDLLKKQKKS